MQFDPSFMALSNPTLTLPKPKSNSKYDPETLFFSPRLFMVIQPPLGEGEILPSLLRLNEGEKAILFAPAEGYIWVKTVDLYVPQRHRMVVELVENEISDGEQHGGRTKHCRDCNGPLCRRRTRMATIEWSDLKRMRENRHLAKPLDPWHKRVKSAWPQHYAIDPLLHAYQSHHEGKIIPDLRMLYPEIV